MTGSGPRQGFRGPGHAPFLDLGTGHVGMFSQKFTTLSTYSHPFPDYYYPLITSKKINIEIGILAMGKQAQCKEGQGHTGKKWQKRTQTEPQVSAFNHTSCLPLPNPLTP